MIETLPPRNRYLDSRLIVSAVVMLTFAVALFTSGAGSYAVIVGAAATAFAAVIVLWVSHRHADPTFLWFALDLALLISGLIAILVGFAKYQDSEHEASLKIARERVVERRVALLRAATIAYFECSGKLVPPIIKPDNNCSRLGHFAEQMKDQLQIFSSTGKDEGSRWDLNLCPENVRAESKSWDLLCDSAKSLAASQDYLQNNADASPTGILAAMLSGRSLFFWLLLTGVLYGAKIAKFIADATVVNKAAVNESAVD